MSVIAAVMLTLNKPQKGNVKKDGVSVSEFVTGRIVAIHRVRSRGAHFSRDDGFQNIAAFVYIEQARTFNQSHLAQNHWVVWIDSRLTD